MPVSNDRIRVLRPVLVLLIVTVHVPLALYRPDLSDVELSPGSYLSALISGCIAIAALPTLSVFSGYLAAAGSGRRGYPAYALRKFRRLIVPMIAWGLPMAIWIYTRQSAGIAMRPDLELYPFNLEGWFRALTAYQKLPANAPLYFLRELFLAALLLPLWRLVARNITASVIVAAAIFYCAVAGIQFGFFIRIDIYLYFFIGVFVAAHPGLAIADDWIRDHALSVLLVFLAACLPVAFYGFSNDPQHYWLLINLLRLTGPLAFLALGAYLAAGRVGNLLARLAPASYTVFLGHVIVIRLVWWVWQELVGVSRHDAAWWTFFGLAVLLSAASLGLLWWGYNRLRKRLCERLRKRLRPHSASAA